MLQKYIKDDIILSKMKVHKLEDQIMDDAKKRLLAYQKLISKAVSIRKESGKTMQDVADDAGIAQPNIARLEKMEHEVKVSTLLAYLDSLDCTFPRTAILRT